MKVSITDDVYAQYEAAAARAKVPTEVLINRQLARFVAFPVTQRVIALTGDPLQALETQLSGGQLKSAEDLVQRVHRWAGITIGGIRLNFSEAQLAEIALRAEKQGKSPKAIVEDIVAQMESNFFWEPVVTR